MLSMYFVSYRSAFSSRRKPIIPAEDAFNVPTYVLRHTMNGQIWPDGDEFFHNWLMCPTLLIYGLKDELVSLEEEQEMADVSHPNFCYHNMFFHSDMCFCFCISACSYMIYVYVQSCVHVLCVFERLCSCMKLSACHCLEALPALPSHHSCYYTVLALIGCFFSFL